MIRSIMWQYIEEEPTYLLNILNNPENKEVIQKVKDFDTIYICAHGSSYNAATSVASFISDMFVYMSIHLVILSIMPNPSIMKIKIRHW